MHIDNIRIMKKYRHILAAMINQSDGYFTPKTAAQALTAYKKKVPFSCGKYLYMAGLYRTKTLLDITDEELIEINHRVISLAFHGRKYHQEKIKLYLEIINQNINEDEFAIADYF